MNLRSLDLNLLVVFDAIYREGNVTRAANRVGLSQPATSNALTRLRGHLKDELFLRGPEGLRPTPRAVEMAPRLRTILIELEHLLELQEFDPTTARRTLTIAAIDYFSVVIVPALIGILAKEAPGIKLQMVPSIGRSVEALDHGEIDFASAAFGELPERISQIKLLDDYYCCLVRRDHELTKKKLTMRRYAQAKHLLVSPGGHARGFVDDLLAESGLTRNISLITNHFAATPPIIENSDLIMTAPKRVLNQLYTPNHVVLKCPVSTPEVFRYADLIWHDRLSRHPAHVWLRNAIIRAAKEVADQGSYSG